MKFWSVWDCEVPVVVVLARRPNTPREGKEGKEERGEEKGERTERGRREKENDRVDTGSWVAAVKRVGSGRRKRMIGRGVFARGLRGVLYVQHKPS